VKFWLGLGIGVVLGAGAMYLAVHRGGGAPVPPDAGVVAIATDAGVPAKKKPRRHRVGGGGTTVSLDEGIDDAPAVVLTDGDRKLVWQGDDVSIGARTIDMSAGGDDARPLEQGEINAGLSSGASSFEHCISSSVAGAELSSSITLQMQVDGKGQVAKVRVQAAQWLFAHGLYACMRGAAKRLSFAATGAPTVVTEPFTLD
jgi:hypothetical protein